MLSRGKLSGGRGVDDSVWVELSVTEEEPGAGALDRALGVGGRITVSRRDQGKGKMPPNKNQSVDRLRPQGI